MAEDDSAIIINNPSTDVGAHILRIGLFTTMAHVATMIRRATISRDAQGVRYVKLIIIDKVERYHKVGDATVLGETNSLGVSYKYLLKQLSVFASDAAEADLNDTEFENVLKNATIEADVENFKAGDKYVDEAGVEQEHKNNGTDTTITDIVLRRGALDKIFNTRDTLAKSNAIAGGILDAAISRGIEASKINFVIG